MNRKKTVKQAPAVELSRSQLDDVIKILKDVGSVELKVVAPMHTHRATIGKLGLDPIEAEVRQVYFFDTPNLDLNKAGVVVRARRIQGGAGDTVIKLRPVEPAAIDKELRRSGSFKTEVDVGRLQLKKSLSHFNFILAENAHIGGLLRHGFTYFVPHGFVAEICMGTELHIYHI